MWRRLSESERKRSPLPSTPVGEEPPPEEAAPAPEPEPTPDPPSDPQAARWFLDETRPLDRKANGGWGIGGETLLPPEHDDEEAASSSTVPLATLRRMIDEQEATEIDVPALPQDYAFDED